MKREELFKKLTQSLCETCANRFYIRYRYNECGHSKEVMDLQHCNINHNIDFIRRVQMIECSFYKNKEKNERKLEMSTMRQLS